VQQKLGLFEQQTIFLLQWNSLYGPQIFPQTIMWPFMLAVLDCVSLGKAGVLGSKMVNDGGTIAEGQLAG